MANTKAREISQMSAPMPKVEECIAWAAQMGYCFAQDAANEYGERVGRIMGEDDNTAMYGTRSWRNAID